MMNAILVGAGFAALRRTLKREELLVEIQPAQLKIGELISSATSGDVKVGMLARKKVAVTLIPQKKIVDAEIHFWSKNDHFYHFVPMSIRFKL